MNANEIDALAKGNAGIDISLPITEIGLYYKLNSIYRGYDSKKYTAKEAKKKKADALEEYEHEKAKDAEISELSDRISQHLKVFREQDRRQIAIEMAMSDAQKNGCERCRKLVAALDGRTV